LVAPLVPVDDDVVALLDDAATAIATAAATATPAAIVPVLRPVSPSDLPAVKPVGAPLPVLAACDCASAKVGAAAKASAKPKPAIVFLTTITEDLQFKTFVPVYHGIPKSTNKFS
jgi:hypothetical protein